MKALRMKTRKKNNKKIEKKGEILLSAMKENEFRGERPKEKV